MNLDDLIFTEEFEEQVNHLTPMVVDVILDAVRNEPGECLKRLIAAVMKFPARKFTRLLLEFDAALKYVGVSSACEHIYPYFFDDMVVQGVENVPKEGPLILASNHPGGLDFISIAGHAKRDDLKVIASDVDFLRELPEGRKSLINMPDDPRSQFKALKEALKHLEQGGMLILFPTGLIDPDPKYFRNAKEHIERWSKSLEIFVRKVSEVQIQPIIVSEAIGERFLFKHPLVKAQKRRIDRQRLAEFLQVMNMVFFKGSRFNLKISFGEVMRYHGNGRDGLTAFYQQIKLNAVQLLDRHMMQFPATRQELWIEKEPRFKSA